MKPARCLSILFTLVFLCSFVAIPAAAAAQILPDLQPTQIAPAAQDQPDLQPTQIAATTLYSGVSNSVTVIVANNTAVASGDFTIKLEYSASSSEFSQVGAQTGSLPSSADPYYYPLSVNFKWTPTAPGSYTLRAIIDSENTVNESNEENNLIQQEVTVIPLVPINVKVRIEGQTSTLFSGTVNFSTSTITDKQGQTYTVDHPTALGALDKAARTGQFGYVVSSSWGPLAFIEKVGNDANSGMNGWLARVNWQGLNVAAIDYSLAEGDEVLWYFGGWMAQPLRLSLDQTSLLASETFTATVEEFNGASWNATAGATLQAGSQKFKTDSEGKVSNISLTPGGYTLSASMGDYETYIRSNSLAVIVYLPLVLEPGWNFISVPRRLAADHSTAEALFGNVDTAGHSIFTFDPAQGGWKALQAADLISPLDGIWIYSAQQTELRPVFDTERRQVPPSKKLASGWNAIGFSDFTAASANSSLTSVEALWSTLVGFDEAHQVYEASIINNAPEDDAHSEKRPMSPWKGYWLHMTAESELAAVSP